MIKKKSLVLLTVLIAVFALFASSCSSDSSSPAKNTNSKGRENVQKVNGEFEPPEVKNFTEYHNYMKAQELYDSPSSIIWCTSTWGNAGAPMFTVPIAGKLTSSSVSLFPSSKTLLAAGGDGSKEVKTYNSELPSVDGMFHGSPPAYRYGFTPGGQYVDFSGMEVFCTTALTVFQRDNTIVATNVDQDMQSGQAAAEKALEKCQAGDTKEQTTNKLCDDAQKAIDDVLQAGG